MSDEGEVRNISGHVALGLLRMEGRMRSRMGFSIVHLLAALRFARMSHEAEQAADGDAVLQFSPACVLSGYAALEGYANELFFADSGTFPDQDSNVVKAVWPHIERQSVLEKFQFALVLRKARPLTKGAAPCQNFAALQELRNALVHFKVEWEDDKKSHAKVGKALKDRFIVPAGPGSPGGQPSFPSRWACYACTRWVVETCLAFAAEFERLSGLNPLFKGIDTSLPP